ncbi:MAG: type VI secretion system baseplate subunit TssF, partial [Planctomycetes bacterium]|nr:type VI secretion system baseplate subunit TssF [Planctomycetota bacterium]
GQPHMELVDGEPIASIECLTSPTPTYRVPLRHGMLWRLISHLSVNHLSLCDGEEGAEALREILALYDFAESEETRAMIEGVRSIATRRVVGRTGGGVSGGLCRGLEVSITFDETRFVGESVFLFASVLERFLGLYCSINSFTQLIARTSKQERNLKQWPPRAGERVLL